jgi:rhodanese-related sulfurtransferase
MTHDSRFLVLSKIRLAFIATLISLLIGCSANAATPYVSLEQARDALAQKTAVVLDIREGSEHVTGVAEGAKLMPMGQIANRIAELPNATEVPLYVICNTQNRSARVVEQLRAAGFTNASYVMGGMSAWASRGWPMVKPQ